MFSRETLETALHRFRTHPVQMALTLAGLVVGTSAIILIVALGLTGRAFVMAQIEGVGSHLVWAEYEGTVNSGVARTLDDDITDGDVKAIAERTDLFTGVTPLVVLQGKVSVLARATNLNVLGTIPNYTVVRKNVKIVQGRFLDEDDILQRAKVCVVNRDLYDRLFGHDTSPDKTVRTLGTTFQVIGVFEKPVDTMGQGEVIPESIFIPITVSWLFTPTRSVNLVFAEVREFSEIERAASTVGEILRSRHHQGSVFKIKTMTTVIKLARADLVRPDRRLHHCGRRVGDRRSRRDHEHPSGVGRAAHAGDRPAHVDRRPPPGHPPAVPARGAPARSRRLLHWRSASASASRSSPASSSGRSTSRSPRLRLFWLSRFPAPSRSCSASYRRTAPPR